MKYYFTYILQCNDGSFYTGMTNNLERRLQEHKSGKNKNSYTYDKRPDILKWHETFTNSTEAIRVEKQIKGWSRRKKMALIEENGEKLIEYSRNYTQYGSSTSSD